LRAAGVNFRHVASSSRHPANSRSTCTAVGGIRGLACCRPRGRFISSIGHCTTRPVIWWISTLCRGSRNKKKVFSACARDSRVPLAVSRNTFPKYTSASGGSSSHNARPNHARTCSRCTTSEAIVESAKPAAARARTNPASTSVSNAARSSGVAGARATRGSRTTARLNRGPLIFTQTAGTTGKTIDLQENRDYITCQKRRRSTKNAQVLEL
jgi:hypothetical protein